MKPQVTTVAISIALFGGLTAGQALAASAMPAAGEGPLFSEREATASTLTRAEVHAAAVQAPPPAGEQHAAPHTLQAASALTRAEVHAGAVASPPVGGEAGMLTPTGRRIERAASADTLARELRPASDEQG